MSEQANTIVASNAKTIQFPLVLAFGVTVHKIQGQTIERPMKIVIDLKRFREGGQGYVASSRIKELVQLFTLDELLEKKIYPNHRSLEEIRRLWEVSINNNPTSWDEDTTSEVTKISFLNTRS